MSAYSVYRVVIDVVVAEDTTAPGFVPPGQWDWEARTGCVTTVVASAPVAPSPDLARYLNEDA